MPAVIAPAILALAPGIGALGAQIVGSIIVTAVSYGIGEYVRAQNTRPRDVARNAFADDGRKQVVRQAVPVKRSIYGTVLTSGPMFFYDVSNPWLTVGILLSDGPIAGVDLTKSVQVAGNTIRFNPVSFEAIDDPYQTATRIYAYASFRNGSADQAIDPLLAANFPGLPSTFRQRGIATAVIRMHWGDNQAMHDRLWGSSPNPLFLVRGRLVHDPRRAGSVATDSSTWTYSDNAALIVTHWLLNRWRHPVRAEEVDWDAIARAADLCDQWVPRLSGTPERRYTANGIVMGDDPHYETARQMLSSLNGQLTYRNGLYAMLGGTSRTPVATITDTDIKSAIRHRFTAPVSEAVNTIRTVFVAPDREWEKANGPVLAPAAYIAADQRVNSAVLDLPFTASQTTAQRLAKQAMEERRLGRTLQTVLDHSFIGLEVGDVVRVSLRTLSYLDGLYSVQSCGFAKSGIPVDLRAYANAPYAWSTAEEQPFTLSPAEL